jgi:hypothetical protein
MVDEFEYHRIDKPRKSRVSIRLLKAITGGVEGAVSKVSTTLHNDSANRTVGTMITKEICVLSNLPETRYLELKKKYSYLKKRGLPVVPTFRINREQDTLLMSDVTESGKFILIDKHFPLSKFNKKIVNIRELHAQIRIIAIKAFNDGNGVVLGSDSYSIVFDPTTNTARVILLDIGRGTYIVSSYRARGRSHSISEELASQNAEHAIHYYFT